MKISLVDVEQGSPEWKAARAGKVTASKIKDLMATIKSGESASRRDYRTQIVTEILTQEPAADIFQSAEMKWGIDQEPNARLAFEREKGVMVATVGFVLHPTIERAGSSPDGLIGWDGENEPDAIVQFKCPKSSTHLNYIMEGKVPTDYQPQMLWEMACTGAKGCWFVSYDPRFFGPAKHLQLFCVWFPRDEARIKAITAEVLVFLKEAQQFLDRLEALRPTGDIEVIDLRPAPEPAPDFPM